MPAARLNQVYSVGCTNPGRDHNHPQHGLSYLIRCTTPSLVELMLHAGLRSYQEQHPTRMPHTLSACPLIWNRRAFPICAPQPPCLRVIPPLHVRLMAHLNISYLQAHTCADSSAAAGSTQPIRARDESVDSAQCRLAQGIPSGKATKPLVHTGRLHWPPACQNRVNQAYGYPRIQLCTCQSGPAKSRPSQDTVLVSMSPLPSPPQPCVKREGKTFTDAGKIEHNVSWSQSLTMPAPSA